MTVETTRTVPPTYTQNKSSKKVYRVRHNLQEVAQRLSAHPYSGPKCLTTDALLSKKRNNRLLASPNSITSSFSASDSEEYGMKRSAHNVMERKRRGELRDYLHILRDQLPIKADRPAKVLILERAKDAVEQLTAEEKHYRQELVLEKQRNSRLKSRLAQLQAQMTGSL